MTVLNESRKRINDQTRELTITELEAVAGGFAQLPLAGVLVSQQPKTSIDATLACRKAGRDQQD